jgi:hypothetical protein
MDYQPRRYPNGNCVKEGIPYEKNYTYPKTRTVFTFNQMIMLCLAVKKWSYLN